MSAKKKTPALVGIQTRHTKACASRSGGKCSCDPSYRAEVHDPVTKRPAKSPWYKVLADARAWRVRAQAAILDGSFRSVAPQALEEACEAWLRLADSGFERNRSGARYKGSVLASYETSLRLHIYPTVGSRKFSRVRRSELQQLVDQLQLTKSPETVRNAITALRAVYRRAVQRDVVPFNPTIGLVLPAVTGSRDRVAAASEASQLLAALPESDRAVWATATYAGLRLGELRALDWAYVDLESGLIRVEFGWDPKVGPITPKSKSGVRIVPIPAVLNAYLRDHQTITGRSSDLVFGRSSTDPFSDTAVRNRAKRTWTAQGLNPIGFHEARHTYASFMIAAGVNAKTLSTLMGHASITITLDRYGHLFPGAESAAAASLDAYLQAV